MNISEMPENIVQTIKTVLRKCLHPSSASVKENNFKRVLHFLNSLASEEILINKQEICKSCLLETAWQEANLLPSENLLGFAVNVTKIAINNNQHNFLELCEKRFLEDLISLLKINNQTRTNKLNYLDFINAVCQHFVGVKWVLINKYWEDIYELSMETLDKELKGKAVKQIVSILETSAKHDKRVCNKLVDFLSISLSYEVSVNQRNLECLVEVLEKLLERASDEVLQVCIDLKVDQRCEYHALKNKTGKSISVILNRMSMILSLFKMTQNFVGIKVVERDPIEMCGFLSLLQRELKKNFLEEAILLCYYTAKYFVHVANKIPKFYRKNNELNLGEQAVILLQMPLNSTHHQSIQDAYSRSHFMNKDPVGSHFFKCCSDKIGTEVWRLLSHVGNKFDKLPFVKRFNSSYLTTLCPTHIVVLDCLRDNPTSFVSREVAEIVVCTLYFHLSNFVRSLAENEDVSLTEIEEKFMIKFVATITVYFREFEIRWAAVVSVLNLTDVLLDFLTFHKNMSSELTENVLQLLNVLIDKNMDKSMVLLMDMKNSSLFNIGPLLSLKSSDQNWKVRKAAIDVVGTISAKAQKNFENVKEILTVVDIPDKICSIIFNDPCPLVRSSAIRATQNLIDIPEVCETLINMQLLDKLLHLLTSEKEEQVRSESVLLLVKIIRIENVLKSDMSKICEKMIWVALNDPFPIVKKSAVTFYGALTEKIFEENDFKDGEFPRAIFSKKKIVILQEDHYRKRILQAIYRLFLSGCIPVLDGLKTDKNNPLEVIEMANSIIQKVADIINQYEIDPKIFESYTEFFSTASSPKIKTLSERIEKKAVEYNISPTMIYKDPVKVVKWFQNFAPSSAKEIQFKYTLEQFYLAASQILENDRY